MYFYQIFGKYEDSINFKTSNVLQIHNHNTFVDLFLQKILRHIEKLHKIGGKNQCFTRT